MRIGFDAKRFFNNATGLGQYSRFIVNALSNHFSENSYWLYTPHYKYSFYKQDIQHRDNIQLRIPHKVTSALGMSSYWRTIALGKVARRDGMDIFHGLSNELPWIKPKKVKMVVTIHDLMTKRYPELYAPIDVRVYALKLARACANADLIIAISHQTKQDICNYLHVDERKIRIVRQGYNRLFEDREIPNEKIVEIRKRRALPDEFILTVGTIEPRKNALLIVKALNQLRKKIPLVIVGKPTKYMMLITDYITKYNLTTHVIFIHDADPLELVVFYRLAQLFIYPSIFEGFGIPIIEAISSGVPVIASDSPCFVETGGPHIARVDPHNAEHLAITIEDILSDESKQKEMIQQARKHIVRYQPSRIAQNLMDVYQELV